ncbi:MAG: RNA polymerase sigma-70 factor [Cyclobacteriaceae bacterium]
MKVNENIIISEVKNRNRDVFKALFNDYYSDLTRYAERFVFGRQESEDIVQALFIYIWENAEHINITGSLKSYLFQAVRNRCLNHLRDLKVSDKHKLLYLEATEVNDGELADNDPEVVEPIKHALCQLPEEMAKIFDLKYIQGKKQREIADSLHISENTVKTQLLRAKKKLREVLSQLSSPIHSL